MVEPLTQADIERMKAEHADDGGACDTCWVWDDRIDGARCVVWPCDAARLLDFIETEREATREILKLVARLPEDEP